MLCLQKARMADRWCWEGRQPKGRCQAVTAFKSDEVMHLRGKAAQRWIAKIKKDKEEQERMRKAKSVWTGESR